jgi:hypothetical protein
MQQKKSYEKPVVVSIGTVKGLTAGVGGSNADPGQVSQTKRGGG